MKMCKYTKSIVFFFALLAVSCSMQEKDFKDSRENPGKVFYASIEVPVGEAETKVYADDDLSVLWHEDDRVSIFNKNTYNQEYRFTGKTGSNAGSFEKVTSGGFVTGNPLSSVYSVYPYSASTEISNQGLISVDLPSTQTYAQHSFGPNANTMVSVSSDEMLLFKNVGGYLVLRLYGEDVEVSSITLKGNNNEKLAGKATVRIIAGENPSVDMSNDAAKEITLTCENPVTIGNTAAGYTEFWFVTPPVTFSKGITIRVNGPKGSFFEKSSSKAISVGRNTVSRMAAIEVELSGGEDGFVVFKDDNFKAYCVENFDTDNDGKISIDEALVVTEIWVSTTNIESLEGIEFFENLQQLTCSGGFSTHGKLTNLDISKNTALTSLWCSYNLLTSLDVSKNTELTELTCNNNLLTSLDVSKNTKLTYLNCYNQLYSSCNNQLTSLDLSNNSALTELYLDSNLLTSLDVSKNTELTVLSCSNNQLTSINVSKNTALTRLSCWKNQLTSINLSNNSALTELYLDSNLLTSLDVSKNTELTVLSCPNNQLTSINVSKNTSLTSLSCGYNQLTSLDVSKNTALTYLDCSNNLLTSLDVSKNISLTRLECVNNPLLTEIWLMTGQIIKDFSYDANVASIMYLEDISDHGIKFANPHLKARLVEAFDTNFDGELSYEEASAVTSANDLKTAIAQGDKDLITSFDEFQFFTGLDSLASGTFESCHNLQSIILPSSLKVVDGFTYCEKLASIDIPDGVTTIMGLAFHQAKGLKTVHIPASVKTIGDGAFSYTSVKYLYIDSLESWLAIEIGNGGHPFSPGIVTVYNKKTIFDTHLYIAGKEVTQIIIPDGTTAIKNRTFHGCGNITSVSIPASVQSIGQESFQYCMALNTINGASGVTQIDAFAFYECNDFGKIVFPPVLQSVGMAAFQNCKGIKEIILGENIKSIHLAAFNGCSNVTRIIINSTTIPTGGSQMFDETNGCSIYVPAESVDSYKYAEYWRDYANRIQALTE